VPLRRRGGDVRRPFRRPKDVKEWVESRVWRARDHATSAVGLIGDATSDLVSKAGDQIDPARDAARLGSHSPNDSAGKRL
jgi:hypothetical protein